MGQCLSGLSVSGIRHKGGRPPAESHLVTGPGYCPDCYLEVEEQLCAFSDAEFRELEVDAMHLKGLLNITRSKHEDELRELGLKFLQEQIAREGDDGDGRDKTARWGREQRKIRALQKRHQEVEEEVAQWVEDADLALQRNRRVRAEALLDFRIRQGP